MTQAAIDLSASADFDLLATADAAMIAVDRLLGQAEAALGDLVAPEGKVDGARLDAEQIAAHGFAWYRTYGESLRQLLAWARRLEAQGRLNEAERLTVQIGFGEYLAQMAGGIALSQVEIVRPADIGLGADAVREFQIDAVTTLIAANTAAAKKRLGALLADGTTLDPAYEDETLTMMVEQFERFCAEKVVPFAHEWHLKDELIPLSVVEEMAELGVFGLTIAEEHGGLGLGKAAMCVVTEALSRAYIGVGSLGTRSEIAGELIQIGGTPEQKRKYLPKIASGEILPTAVFTEPNTGSDLGSLKTRAVKQGDTYVVNGNKTWITHASRSDLMTMLVRTNPDEAGYRGLSMLLAEKPRGTDADPFPAKGMSGGEIEVLGYRGMKEYELAFDDFAVPAGQLLGGEEGQGFKQLMSTFEGARIQTAARAVGVAQNAFDIGLRYALDRVQFGKALAHFPRVSCKLAWMAVETMIARQLTLFSANEKDSGRRCDIEAGMAKLLAARVAWSNADNALQIHGGNGYALEYQISRVICDARILNIFEGAAEIQAHVVARGLLARGLGARN